MVTQQKAINFSAMVLFFMSIFSFDSYGGHRNLPDCHEEQEVLSDDGAGREGGITGYIQKPDFFNSEENSAESSDEDWDIGVECSESELDRVERWFDQSDLRQNQNSTAGYSSFFTKTLVMFLINTI